MSSFVIKIIAILTMTIDHVNDIFYKIPLLNMIGRIAFPLFCFQVVVGYSKTRDLKKYLLRLLLFAIVSQIPYYFFMQKFENSFHTNVITTLFFGVISMYLYDIKIENIKGKIAIIDGRDNILFKNLNLKYDLFLNYFCTVIKCTLIIIIMSISYIINSDYTAWGILLILIIHAFYPFDGTIKLLTRTINTNKFFSVTMFLITMAIMSLTKYLEFYGEFSNIRILEYAFFTFLPSIYILSSNGKKGINMKYFFYVYYPLHLIVILLLDRLL